jgi:hypothetical protein
VLFLPARPPRPPATGAVQPLSCSLVPVILVAYAEVVPEALNGLAGEERMRLYEMPRLEVMPNPGGYEVSESFVQIG